MNAFEKLTDLSIAFICMFLVPFLFLQNAELELEQQRAKEAANYFLECVQNKGMITEELCRNLSVGNYSAVSSLSYEIVVKRTEYLPENMGGEIRVSYSWSEILGLLNQNKNLPLAAGDSVEVRVYGCGIFGQSSRILTDLERSI